MRVLVVLEGKKIFVCLKKFSFDYKCVFKDFDSCYLC